MPWSPSEEDFIRKFLFELKPGELRKEPIETDYDFRLVRLLQRDDVRGPYSTRTSSEAIREAGEGRRWRFESVTAAKVSQEDFFKSAPKMRLEVSDEELRAWLKSIHGNPRLAAAEIR